MEKEYILEMNHICKEYSGNRVLDDVSIRVKPGQIVALIGENGAGKSTIMNVLFGMPVIRQTGGFKGNIIFDGKEVQIGSPLEAMKLGIGMVHQEFMLIDGYDVAENIKLNRENVKKTPLHAVLGRNWDLLDREAMHRESATTLERLGIHIRAEEHVGSMAVGYKQFIEIARELDKSNARLVVLDEPTAVLTEIESEEFMNCVRNVARRGISFIFISHKLNEIKQLADYVYILRDGQMVGDYPSENLSPQRMSELMVGRKVELIRDESRQAPGEDVPICLETKELAVNMPGEVTKGVNLQVRKGEIFGIAGLAGHGKIGIPNGIMGLYPHTGRVYIDGVEADTSKTKEVIARGLTFVSEDRRGVGLLLDESIEVNIAVAAMKTKNMFIKKRLGISFYDSRSAKEYALRMIEELDIRCTGPDQPAGSLSGGNQQKVCIARALAMEPEILFVSEPTRGIDIGAKKIVLDTLMHMNKEKSTTLIVTSSELAELRSMCDRIAIITDGRVAGILPPDAPDYQYGMLMSGMEAEEQEVVG